MPLDWKPRGRDLVIGDIPWLARISDKARASLNGSLGDYVYPCPADQAFLNRHGVPAETFTKMVDDNPSDDQMIEKMRAVISKNQKK